MTERLGECRMSLYGGLPWIDQADPRILISEKLLDMARDGEVVDGVTLTITIPAGAPAHDRYAGSVLRIEAANQTVVYRITGRVAGTLLYAAERPD